MKIYQHKDFEVWYIQDSKFKDVYWAEIGKDQNFSFLRKDGSLVKVSDLLFEVVEYRTIEELEDALSLYYKSPQSLPFLRTQKKII